MGTSTSAKGPSSRSPLVPPWADAEPGAPLPHPEGQRFRGFRTEFGKAVAGSGSLGKALQKYASDATYGSAVGPRRFGPAYSAGAGLVRAFGAGPDTEGEPTRIDLEALAGRPLDEAAQAIAEALAPENADSDQIRSAVQEAIAEVLGDQGAFDPGAISPDQIVALLVEFFARILFQEISATAGEAWKKAPNVDRNTAAENELFEVVRAAMDTHLSPRLARDLQTLDRASIEAIERAAIVDIWRAWEEGD